MLVTGYFDLQIVLVRTAGRQIDVETYPITSVFVGFNQCSCNFQLRSNGCSSFRRHRRQLAQEISQHIYPVFRTGVIASCAGLGEPFPDLIGVVMQGGKINTGISFNIHRCKVAVTAIVNDIGISPNSHLCCGDRIGSADLIYKIFFHACGNQTGLHFLQGNVGIAVSQNSADMIGRIFRVVAAILQIDTLVICAISQACIHVAAVENLVITLTAFIETVGRPGSFAVGSVYKNKSLRNLAGDHVVTYFIAITGTAVDGFVLVFVIAGSHGEGV